RASWTGPSRIQRTGPWAKIAQWIRGRRRYPTLAYAVQHYPAPMRMRLNRLSTKLVATAAVVGASLTAIACTAGSDHTSNAAANVTSIPESPVTDQGGTGSCWLYSTANWVESLHT